jgi:hypothetical protein
LKDIQSTLDIQKDVLNFPDKVKENFPIFYLKLKDNLKFSI